MQPELLLMTPPPSTQLLFQPLPQEEVAPVHNADHPPEEMDNNPFSHETPGFLFNPLLLLHHNGAEEDLQPPPAPRLRPIDLPEVELVQGHDGLGTNNNSLPAMQLADEFDGQHAFVGQPPLPAQGGIVLDEGFVLQEDPLIHPAAHATLIDNGHLFINEHAEYGIAAWLDEVSLLAHPETDVVDFDPFTLQAWGDGVMESMRTIMKSTPFNLVSNYSLIYIVLWLAMAASFFFAV